MAFPHCLPGPELRTRQVTPRDPGAVPIDDAFHDASILTERMTPTPLVRRQQPRNQLPLSVIEKPKPRTRRHLDSIASKPAPYGRHALALTPLHHQRVIDLHQLAATRYADDYRDTSPHARARYLSTVQHVLLAVGPGFDCSNRHLRWITRLGPATGIHLAVDSRHRDAPLVADEFIDNINGHWSTTLETSYPSTHVSVGILQQQKITDVSRAHAATAQAHAATLGAMFDAAARTAQHAVDAASPWPEDPRIQAVISAAENNQWRVAPYNAGRCDFVHDASGTAVVVRWGSQQWPVRYAAAGTIDAERGADRHILVSDNDTDHSPSGDDPIVTLSRFFAQSIPTESTKSSG